MNLVKFGSHGLDKHPNCGESHQSQSYEGLAKSNIVGIGWWGILTDRFMSLRAKRSNPAEPDCFVGAASSQ